MLMIMCVAIFVMASGVASSHDWYPKECCSGKDCAPLAANQVTRVANGYWIYNRQFWARDKIKQYSPDGQYHVCKNPGAEKAHCFFPPSEGS
jgi:hypothetical protein